MMYLTKHPYKRSTILMIAVITFISMGCATSSSKKETRKTSIDDKLVLMQIQKKTPNSTEDCPVSLKITNRMRDATWDGVSYHLAFTNKYKITVGELSGAPRHPTKSGQHLVDTGKVTGVKCDDLTDVFVIYFGYYPQGKGQVSLHLSHIGAEIR